MLDSKVRGELSFKEKGCNVSCCEHGTPYVSQDERDEIVEKTGKEVFVETEGPHGNYWIIGKNADGSERDLENDACPFLEYCGCSIQNFKPVDCTVHPFFPRVDGEGELEWQASDCCDVYRTCSGDRLEAIKQALEDLGYERINAMNEHQSGTGFPLKKIKVSE